MAALPNFESVSVEHYPDVVAVCGEAQYMNATRDTLLNPALIIAVLSPSTEDYDRGRKFMHYRAISTLQDYLLVSQSHMRVEHITRQRPDEWLLRDCTQPDALIALDSIRCQLTLADIYQKVRFD